MSDTAEYSAVATSSHGTATSKATVIVKSKKNSFSASFPFRLSVFESVITVFCFSQEHQELERPAILD